MKTLKKIKIHASPDLQIFSNRSVDRESMCCFLVIIFLFSTAIGMAQRLQPTADTSFFLPEKYFSIVLEKAEALRKKINARQDYFMQAIQKQEQRIKKKLANKNWKAAEKLFSDLSAEDKYLVDDLKKFSNCSFLSKYIPYLDSLKTSFSFLESKSFRLLKPSQLSLIQAAKESLNKLQTSFDNAEQVKRSLWNRQQLINQQLHLYGLGKYLKKYNRHYYYYTQQLLEYKEILKDPSKIEQKAMRMLWQLPALQVFMQKNTQLAAIIKFPSDNNMLQHLQGLQSKNDLSLQIHQKLTVGGSNSIAFMQQGIQEAQSQLRKLKQLVKELGESDNDITFPDFKPNTQRAKPFLKRLVIGSNLQSAKSNYFFPTTTAIELSLGYKLNDRSLVGLGMSYKVGWRNNFRQFNITQEGIGISSFIDWKWKGSLFISGGYEQHYWGRFENLQQLKREGRWIPSGLMGIGKKYAVGKKMKGNMKLLYDFLYKTHAPFTQPVIMRFGYDLKVK